MLELLLSRAQAPVVASAPQEGGAAPGHRPRGRQRAQDQAGRVRDQAGRQQDLAQLHERSERTWERKSLGDNRDHSRGDVLNSLDDPFQR